MKKIFTLVLGLVLTTSLFAQKIDYDTDSKWYLGFNVGGTWNSSDVKTKTHAGWGLLLGKHFNYNYGKVLSYDLRLRYLGGNWYGQDLDTMGLANYAPEYMPDQLQAYKDGPGYTVRNFNTSVHELGLELAIHFGRLRENTGWDPYIFGGANLAWNQTFSDLTNVDTLLGTEGLYDYSNGVTKSSLNTMLDGQFETAMNSGSENLGWNVDFVPSLGIGLGYQVGPRFSLGIEHKTSFAMKDDWDGYFDPSTADNMLANDMYHYTSFFMKFGFKTKGSADGGGSTQQTNSNNLTNGGCQNPVITFITPTQSGITVDQQMFTVRMKVEKVANRDHVVFRLNGQPNTNFFFNETSGELEASVLLINGVNTIQVQATNGCGTTTLESNITFNACLPPVVSFTAPNNTNTTTNASPYTLRAKIDPAATSVAMNVNGLNSSNFYYNAANGSFESSVSLINGNNVIQIIAVNACGTTTQSTTINYSNCINPEIAFLIADGITVTNAQLLLKATVSNVASKANIGLRLNGVNQNFNYILQNKRVETTLNLVPGNNTIQITAVNDCGSIAKSITVNYQPCIKPTLSFIAPINGSASTNQNTYAVKFNVNQITAVNQISVKLNNVLVPNVIFNAATGIVEFLANLQQGVNIVAVTVTNDCGSETKSATITKTQNVVDPVNPNPPAPEEKITICHYPPGNNGNPQTLEIPLSAWPAHQAHGDVLGPCPQGNPGNNNGNNGHGNNDDGVDNSNPGNGNGGPGGAVDPSGNVDDEDDKNNPKKNLGKPGEVIKEDKKESGEKPKIKEE